jgi:hypothetical protein
MTDTPQNIKDRFFKTLLGDIPIEEFENWVYNSSELETYLGSADYTDFISLDYKSQGAKYEIQNFISKYIDKSEFETWKVKILLLNALNRTEDYVLAIRLFYDLYFDGYKFMDNLGLGYGLTLDCPYSPYGLDSFEELTNEQKDNLVNSFYPAIIVEIQKVLNWIESRSIILTGNQDEYNHFEYIDNRSESDKLPTTYKIAKVENKEYKTEWWKIWK